MRRFDGAAQHRTATGRVVLALALAAGAVGCRGTLRSSDARIPDPDDVRAIERLLAEQDAAWDRGDLAGFVAGYAEGERMTYVGKGGAIVRGRRALEDRYRASYPEGRRGTLSFSELDVRRVGRDAYLVLGRWALDLPPDHPHGRFTLVLERGANGLEIIHDHSSGSD
jgi:beta-aspartyl-peptidase (threonine type)